MAQTTNIPTPFRLQKFGALANGASSKTTVLTFTINAPSTDGYVDGIGNLSKIVHFGATVANGGANSLFQLEVATDGVNFTEVQRIEIADNRTDVISLSGEAAQWILAGYTARVSLTQGTTARAAAWLYGGCAKKDIADI